MIKFIFYLFFGTLLILIAIKKTRGPKKNYLLFAGISAILAFVSGVLHNFVYIIFAHFFGHDFWLKIGFGGDELFFFYLASFIFPLAVIIYLLGAMIYIFKKDNEGKKELFFFGMALVLAIVGFVFCFLQELK